MDNWEKLRVLLKGVEDLPLDEMFSEAERQERVGEDAERWGQEKNKIRLLRGVLKWL